MTSTTSRSSDPPTDGADWAAVEPSGDDVTDPLLRRVVVATGVVLVALIAVNGRSQIAAALVVLVTSGTALACLRATDPEDRAFMALSALLTLNVGLPFTRVPDARILLQVVTVAFLVLGIAGAYELARPLAAKGMSFVIALVTLMTIVTVLSPDVGAFKRWLLSALVALPAFVLAARPGARATRRITATVLVLGVIEALCAVVEPFVFPSHLWAPAQRDSDGLAVPLLNDVLGGSIERSQGTLGHPLPLGYLLVIGVALAVRAPRFPRRILVPVLGVLVLGLVVAGARTSLVIAGLIIIFAAARRPTFLHVLGGVWLTALLTVLGSFTGLISGASVDALMRTGSYTHRLGALTSFGDLLEKQDLTRALFGNGFAAAPRLFGAGLLQNDGFNAVDNEFLSLLGQAGLVGLALFVAVVIAAAVTGRSDVRLAVLCTTVTLMVFDVLAWPSAAALAFAVLGMGLRPDPYDDRVPASVASTHVVSIPRR